ncbi:MAG: hypothetical protein KME42_26930 [Tildeniella nuda ZEHNDER 1965/U140]|nr:hypothetical protein [Tildeniella nuda ZEHNDER 1965/U140]
MPSIVGLRFLSGSYSIQSIVEWWRSPLPHLIALSCLAVKPFAKICKNGDRPYPNRDRLFTFCW